VHGPRDWYHPNKKGYEAIAQGILENTSLLKRASTVLEKSENAL
jgi:lysophospholipase L1-like esterase